MFWYFFRITLELSSKYRTLMAAKVVGAQQGLGMECGFMRLIRVWTMA